MRAGRSHAPALALMCLLMTTVAAISTAVTATAMIVTATTTATMAGVKFLFRGITYELDHTYVMQIFTC